MKIEYLVVILVLRLCLSIILVLKITTYKVKGWKERSKCLSLASRGRSDGRSVLGDEGDGLRHRTYGVTLRVGLLPETEPGVPLAYNVLRRCDLA